MPRRRLLRVIIVVVVLAAALLVVSVAWEPPWVASDPLATPYIIGRRGHPPLGGR
jgi:uncharacterized membrane protein YccC